MSDSIRAKAVLGVTGSIAAPKSQQLALRLRRAGFEVRVAMTRSALQVIGEATLRAVSSAVPYTELWKHPEAGETHVEWAHWADLMIIAPATASCISSLWLGQYDNCVTLLASNFRLKDLYLAPAMSESMWQNPAIRRNVAELRSWGVNFLGPVSGEVASGDRGQRMIEPKDLVSEICDKRFSS